MRVKFLDIKKANIKNKSIFVNIFSNFIDSGQYILGKDVLSFERSFAKYIGSKFCVGVGNGLEGLKIILKAANIGKNCSVLVPSNTYIATWLAVTSVGSEIIPVEPSSDYNLDPFKIEKAIKKNTKAIIVTHLYGRSAKMFEINKIAKKFNLRVFEDAAQSHGAKYKNVRTGNLSCAASFSFYPTKNLGCFGDGGAITTNDVTIYKKALLLRNYGSRIKYINEIKGENSRLDALQAIILKKKLKFLDSENKKRDKLANLYLRELKNIAGLYLPPISKFGENVWHLFVVRVKNRINLKKFLDKKLIETMYHYPIAPHRQKAYAEMNFKLPLSEKYHKEVISLPIGPAMSFKKVKYVCSAIKEYFLKNK
jgi:dTDP-4-amino-4,6-dideoxygalactose transaminase